MHGARALRPRRHVRAHDLPHEQRVVVVEVGAAQAAFEASVAFADQRRTDQLGRLRGATDIAELKRLVSRLEEGGDDGR